MSTLHHESILEECYDTAYEEYRISKGIAPKEFYFIMDRDSATYDAVSYTHLRAHET